MKTFTRKIEDFICENCGEKIIGNGYTNHCSKCLYSKHVDINPGDRQEPCNGLMKPTQAFLDHSHWQIMQQCLVCGLVRKNKASKDDNFDVIVVLSQKS